MFNKLTPERIREESRIRNERNASYDKIMMGLSDEELAKVRIGELQVRVKDNVWQLVKKQEPKK